MNTLSKMAVLGASLCSMLALSACQSNTGPQPREHGRMMNPQDARPHLSAEQRQQMKQARVERQKAFEQIKKACDGKAAGASVNIQAGDKTIDGTCRAQFKAERKDMKNMHQEARPQAPIADKIRLQRGEPLTDAKRAELTKQYDQRLAQRQAREQAIAQACQGQSHGKTVQLKFSEKTVTGKCDIRFFPTATKRTA